MKYYETLLEKGSDYILEGVLDYFNERIRIDFYTGNVKVILNRIEQLAQQYSFSKIIVKGKGQYISSFIAEGYVLEAIIPYYFQGNDAYILVKYQKADRRSSSCWVQEDDILRNVIAKQARSSKRLPSFELRRANENDAETLAQLFASVFQIYPTPLNRAEYVRQTMNEDTVYYVYVTNNQIISTASAEINRLQGNAELTNCATLPEFRQHGLMKQLLKALEEELRSQHIFCAYTIARALSPGMNAAFHQLGYSYTGRLANNCYIFDKLEDMNVWTKDLAQ